MFPPIVTFLPVDVSPEIVGAEAVRSGAVTVTVGHAGAVSGRLPGAVTATDADFAPTVSYVFAFEEALVPDKLSVPLHAYVEPAGAPATVHCTDVCLRRYGAEEGATAQERGSEGFPTVAGTVSVRVPPTTPCAFVAGDTALQVIAYEYEASVRGPIGDSVLAVVGVGANLFPLQLPDAEQFVTSFPVHCISMVLLYGTVTLSR